jgi:23S rRNA (pseudouridine1915-N3)-methyltransferase
MKILLLVLGKTSDRYLSEGILSYVKRLKHYVGFEIDEISNIKNRKSLSKLEQKKYESKLILAKLKVGDRMILFDENGKQFNSVNFSKHLQKHMNSGIKRLVFVVGGPHGFHDSLNLECQGKISLSKMTFSHQMIRLFVVEQIYRSMTIMKNEPYHHE